MIKIDYLGADLLQENTRRSNEFHPQSPPLIGGGSALLTLTILAMSGIIGEHYIGGTINNF